MNSRIMSLSSLCTILILICLLVVGCGMSNDETLPPGNQEQFLQDMATGIGNRLSIGDSDVSNLSTKEQITHYKKLISFELDQIEKYERQTFEDAKFDILAHLYISACQMQAEAVENYTNNELFTTLWEGARIVRSGLIRTLYKTYNLPISADQADLYIISTNNDQYEQNLNELEKIFDSTSSKSDQISLSVGDLMVVDADAIFEKSSSLENSYFEFSFTVKNHSSHTLDYLSIECAITDLDGNILGTEDAHIAIPIASGKTAKLEDRIYLDEYPFPFCIVPAEYHYQADEVSIGYEVYVDTGNAKQYTITLSATASANSSLSESPSHLICAECGKTAPESQKISLFGIEEYYCDTHYQEIMDIISMMESDVGSSSQSKHTCAECNKEGTREYNSFTGQTEYYCTEHYYELMNMLKALGIG